MTTYYVDSAAGSNTSPFDTWAKAATTWTSLPALVAGDTVYVASTHNDGNTAALTMVNAGSATSPVRVICADKTSGAPPATVATGGTIKVAAASASLTCLGGSSNFAYFYGLTFNCGSGQTTTCSITPGINSVHDNCQFVLLSTGASSIIGPGHLCIWRNCSVKFGAAGQNISVSGSAQFQWMGGSLLAGGTSPTNLIVANATSFYVDGVDLTNAAAGINLVSVVTNPAGFVARGIKLPASWSGVFVASASSVIAQVYNADNAGTNYQSARIGKFGSVRQETTIVKTGGANNGTTGISWKVVSLTTSGVFPIAAVQSDEIEIWNDTTGATVTVTLDFLHDSLTGLKDNELWITVRYPTNSGNPLDGFANSAPSAVAAGSTLASSTATWTTTGITNPNKQKVAVSFTPQLKGPIYATVWLTKANYTVYVDPLMQLS